MHEIDQDLINTRGSCEEPGKGKPEKPERERPLMRYDWEKQMLVPIEEDRQTRGSWWQLVLAWLICVCLTQCG